METLASCIILLVGIIIGFVAGKLVSTKTTMGRLRIDHSESDEAARLFLELKGVTPDMIARHKFVMFEVINESYLSRD